MPSLPAPEILPSRSPLNTKKTQLCSPLLPSRHDPASLLLLPHSPELQPSVSAAITLSHPPTFPWAVPPPVLWAQGLCRRVLRFVCVPVCSPQPQLHCELPEGGDLPAGPGAWHRVGVPPHVSLKRPSVAPGRKCHTRSVCPQRPPLAPSKLRSKLPRCSGFMEAALPHPGVALSLWDPWCPDFIAER